MMSNICSSVIQSNKQETAEFQPTALAQDHFLCFTVYLDSQKCILFLEI